MDTNKDINKNGFTLIEMVIYIIVIGILTIIAGGIINLGMDNYLFISSNSILTRQAQDVMRFFHKKMVLANSNSISEATASRFRFNAVNGEEIQFIYNQGQGSVRYRILKQTGWQDLLTGIPSGGFSFSFFSGDGSSWSKTSEIRRVQINFTIELAEENATYQTEIYLRN